MRKNTDTYIKHLEEKLEVLESILKDQQMLFDIATELYKRDVFENRKESIANAMIKDKNKEISWSVLFCDINKLKQVNDTCGHAEADKGIKFITDIIKSNTRSKQRNNNLPKDIIITSFENGDGNLSFRLGGDEFLVILPNCRKDIANKISKRIKVSIANSDIKNTKGLSLAIGVVDTMDIKEKVNVTSKEESIAFISKLISMADEKMYDDKKMYTKKLSMEEKNEILMNSLSRVAQYFDLDIYNKEDLEKFKDLINNIDIKN